MLQQKAPRRAYLLEHRKAPRISVAGKCVQPNPAANLYVLMANLALTITLIPSCPLWNHHTSPSSLMSPNNKTLIRAKHYCVLGTLQPFYMN